MVKVCASVGCSSSGAMYGRRENRISFHRFPTEKILRKKWLIGVRRINVKTKELWVPPNSYLCGNHFNADCFHSGAIKRRLKKGACPTIFNEISNSPIVNLAKPRSTLTSIIAKAPLLDWQPTTEQIKLNVQKEHDYAKPSTLELDHAELKKELKAAKQQLAATNKKLKRRDDSVANLSQQLSNKMLITEDQRVLMTDTFSKIQLDMCGRIHSHQGVQFSEEVHEFATTLYIYSPKAYDFVRKQYYLPHPRTIRRWYSGINGQPGFSDQIFETLSSKIQHEGDAESKYCSVLIDGMSVESR